LCKYLKAVLKETFAGKITREELLVLMRGDRERKRSEVIRVKLAWGMSQEELMQAEKGLPDPEISKGDILLYHSEILGEKVLTAYIFASHKLIRAKYMFPKYFPSKAQQFLSPSIPPQTPLLGECFRDFEKFEKAIIAEHGKPYLTTHHELPDRTDQNILGLIIEENAIRRGQTSWFSEWNTKDTLIILLLRAEAEEMRFEIGFRSADLEEEE
jgi:hypothetical protein